jgi:triosephosphate isomerase
MMAANWKMNKTFREAQEYTAALLPRAADAEAVDVSLPGACTEQGPVGRRARSSAAIFRSKETRCYEA